jgi:methyltransferase family protein
MNFEKLDSASARALRYVQNMDGVHGWLLPQAARCIVCLHDAQRRNGVRGSVAEIGVHHGKLFILLCLLRNEGEIAVGYDLFDQQEQNIDRSGKGSLEILTDNLRHMNVGTSHVKLIAANSLQLTGARVMSDSESQVRLFSIDGGHTAEITRNDLSIAAEAIADDGVIILDDFFNEAWPGVATGTAQFFQDNPKVLVPFAIVGNKVLLARTDAAADAFRQVLSRSEMVAERLVRKGSEFFGYPVFVGYDATTVFRVSRRIGVLIHRVGLLSRPRVLAQRIKRKIRMKRVRG